MVLPEFLEYEDGGFIRIKGHRIGLLHVVDRYNEGYDSPQLIHEYYPTLSLSEIRAVIAFYLQNKETVDAYVAKEHAELDRLESLPRQGPTFEELKRRWIAMGPQPIW